MGWGQEVLPTESWGASYPAGDLAPAPDLALVDLSDEALDLVIKAEVVDGDESAPVAPLAS